MNQRSYIPKKENIIATSDVDGVNTIFGYWGPFSYPMRRRLDMAVQAMTRKKGYSTILDAGYGCGILLPDLFRRLSPGGLLYGVDIHGKHEDVRCALEAENVDKGRVFLSDASLAKLPFENNKFDLIVSISVLEHIHPNFLRPVLSEIKRVAKKDADIIIGFPTDCIFIRLLAWIQGQDIKKNHPSTHQDIFESIKDTGFKIVNKIKFPRFYGLFALHYNVRLEPNDKENSDSSIITENLNKTEREG